MCICVALLREGHERGCMAARSGAGGRNRVCGQDVGFARYRAERYCWAG